VVKGRRSTLSGSALAVAFALAVQLTVSLVLPGRASAHAEFVPTLVNRYISLSAIGSRVDVLASLLFGQLPGGERRRQMDRDGNGTIDPRELQQERRYWSQAVDRVIRLAVDGVPVRLTPAAVVDLNADPLVGARPLLVTLQASFELPPGERSVRVEAGPDLPRLGETEIALDIAAGWTLIGSLSGTRPTGTPQRLFQFFTSAGSGPPPSVTFAMRASGPSPAGRSWGRAAWPLLAAAIGLFGVLAWVALRARRSS
jgi:hypothetical protein